MISARRRPASQDQLCRRCCAASQAGRLKGHVSKPCSQRQWLRGRVVASPAKASAQGGREGRGAPAASATAARWRCSAEGSPATTAAYAERHRQGRTSQAAPAASSEGCPTSTSSAASESGGQSACPTAAAPFAEVGQHSKPASCRVHALNRRTTQQGISPTRAAAPAAAAGQNGQTRRSCSVSSCTPTTSSAAQVAQRRGRAP